MGRHGWDRIVYLATERERQGFTQQTLSERSGVPQSVISRLEHTPGAQPSAKTLLALAEALNVHPKALRFGPDPNPPRRHVKAAVATTGDTVND